VTDANLILGRLSPDGLLGGTMALDANAARDALAPAAKQLGFTIERTAHGVLGIVTANMVRAIRAVSVERGHDPREFTLMAFGGAGPLHAVDVARALDMREIVIPATPGILCAQGLVVSDLKEDFVASTRTRVDAGGMADITAAVATLRQRATAWFDEESIAQDRRDAALSFDMRYIGQNFELAVAIDSTDLQPDTLKALFFAAHDMNYGYFNPDDPVEIVNYRLTARGRLDRPAPAAAPPNAPPPVATGQRQVYFDAETPIAAARFERTSLQPGNQIIGPAIIDQLDTTTLIYPGDSARVDAARNLIIELATP
jgi:N-methylhydantoinase A